MKILVIGSGGREHALVWKLAQSPHTTGLSCAPGNAGIAGERLASNQEQVTCHPIAAEDLANLLAWAQTHRPDLTVVGPDNPLAMGIVDLFQAHGLRVWGPNRQAAQFEASKVFAQEFMARHGIPTAKAGAFSDPRLARQFADTLGGRCAVKADGLALGKGVLVCGSVAEAHQAIERMLVDHQFGEACRRIVIQEYLEGPEVSLHALCDGKTALLFPTSQDHKRAFDGNTGPNTGGMGTYSPTPFLNEEQLAAVESAILAPWLRGCAAEGIDFRGLIYPGIMLTAQGPKVLEFNARFGDPETQVYLPRLANDLVELIEASLEGSLVRHPLRWIPGAAVCVVLASGGYPGNYAKGQVIAGLERASQLGQTKVFHAGTALKNGQAVTQGGRVLGVTAWAEDLRTARKRAYEAVQMIHFEGVMYRKDIASQALDTGGAA